MRVLGSALAGAVVAAAVQRLVPGGWWLDSGRGVAISAAAFTVLAALIAGRSMTWPIRRQDATAAAALWVGVNIGLAIVLFSAGPGNLFPIVLAVGAGISALAVGAGSLLGAILAKALRAP